MLFVLVNIRADSDYIQYMQTWHIHTHIHTLMVIETGRSLIPLQSTLTCMKKHLPEAHTHAYTHSLQLALDEITQGPIVNTSAYIQPHTDTCAQTQWFG